MYKRQIHYRRCSDPAQARSAILAATIRAACTMGLEVAEGRKVVNILPPVPANKGTAVERLVWDHRLRSVVYLGDDWTDLDAFRSLRNMAKSNLCQILLVGVCAPDSPGELHMEADFCLSTVGEVVSFLREWTQLIVGGKHAGVRGGSKSRTWG